MKKTLLSKFMLLLTVMVMGVGNAWGAEEVYSTCLFGSSYNSKGVSAYTSTWTATNGGFTWSIANGNNNNNSWDVVKMGRKNNASVGTITTSAVYAEAITKVVVTIDAITADKINSIKLYTSSDNSTWTEAGSYTKSTGAQTVTLSSPTKNLYYKLEFDCASGSSNGLVTVSKIEFYKNVDTGKQDVTLSFPKDSYSADVNDGFEAPTLTNETGVTVTYSSTEEGVATVDSETGAVTLVGTGSTTITASFAGNETYNDASASYTLTVSNRLAPGASDNPYTVAQARAAIDAGTGVTGVYAKGIVSEVVKYDDTDKYITYYISADGLTTSDQLQAYKGKGIDGADFASEDDIQVGDVVVIYGNLKKYSSTYEFDSNNNLVSLTRKTVSSIALSGTYATTFVEGSEFSHEGIVVTATYSDESNDDVTEYASFSTPDMSKTGEQTITVTYQGKTATYTINVTEAPSHTVSFSVNGNSTNESFKEGANIVFPDDPADVLGMKFQGWTSVTIDGTANVAPEYVESAKMGTADVTYYAVFATLVPGSSVNVTDKLTLTTTGVSGTSYTEFSGKSDTSPAVYAGQCAGGKDAIQLRSNNNNSGVITTTSGGKVTKITVTWNSNTASDRTIDIYGSNSAYSDATDLYDNSKQGTKLGSIVYGTSTELTVIGDYTYVGIRSNNGALYLDEIDIDWQSGTPDTYKDYCTAVPTTEIVTIGSALYATYSNGRALDFTGSGVTAYTAQYDAENGKVTLTEVTEVPANTAVILYAEEAGDYTASVIASADALENNDLLVSDGTVTGGNDIYALANKNSKVGFYNVSSEVTIPAGKAYLNAAGAGARAFIGFAADEETTGITSLTPVSSPKGEGSVYTLDGRRYNSEFKISNYKKGLYIVNGKKMVIK